MGWNYRIMKHAEADPTNNWFAVHEVYYNEKGEPNGWTIEPIMLVGDDVDEVKDKVEMILKAFNKPILSYDSESIAEEVKKE